MNRSGSCYSGNCRPFWVATRTFTATCPDGKYGTPVTKTAQAKSRVSLVHAQNLALAKARQMAEAELVCAFKSTRCWTAICGINKCRTRASVTSQAEADNLATLAAKRAAEHACQYPDEDDHESATDYPPIGASQL